MQWLAQAQAGAENKCWQLMQFQMLLETRKCVRTLVLAVQENKTTAESKTNVQARAESKPQVQTRQLPQRCFLELPPLSRRYRLLLKLLVI